MATNQDNWKTMHVGYVVKVVGNGDPAHLSTRMAGRTGIVTDDGAGGDGLVEIEVTEPAGQPVRYWFAPSCLKRRRLRFDTDFIVG